MEETESLLRKFHLSETTGFLLEDPLVELPEYFNPWNFAAKEMPRLVAEKKMRELVDKIDLLDHTKLASYREYRLAHLQMSLIAAGYIWQEGETEPVQSLPECLAVPWCGVSEYLGMKPVISHYSLSLANWRWSEEERRIKCNYRLPGGDEADWFISVTCHVEKEFGHALPHIIDAIRNSDEGNVEKLVDNLNSLTAVLKKMKEIMSTMHDGLSATTFYDVMRPYLSGWGGEDSPLPDGLIYRGMDNQPKKMNGASAAQSSTLPAMDALLGVVHEKESGNFLREMRNYMPTVPREFIGWIESKSNVKTFVEKQSNAKLTEAFDACVKSVVDFRSYHIQIVTKYIIMMIDKSNNDFESLSSKGTGGSDLLPFLKTLRSSASNLLTSSKTAEDKG